MNRYHVAFTLRPAHAYSINAETAYDADARVRIFLEQFGLTYAMLGAAIVTEYVDGIPEFAHAPSIGTLTRGDTTFRVYTMKGVRVLVNVSDAGEMRRDIWTCKGWTESETVFDGVCARHIERVIAELA